MISPAIPCSRIERAALSMQVPSVSASFRHGMTTDTSGESGSPSLPDRSGRSRHLRVDSPGTFNSGAMTLRPGIKATWLVQTPFVGTRPPA